MPELPEVEVCCSMLAAKLNNKIILWTDVRNILLRKPVSQEIVTLHNQYIIKIIRRAKYILIQLNQGWIIIHLGMSGSLNIQLFPSKPNKHDHIDLVINNGYIIRYTDPRRFGLWQWSPSNPLMHDKFLSLGLEPLSEPFNADWLYKQFYKKNTPIKPLLMNNQFVVGIGNIYANESLFLAGILPYRKASSLSLREVLQLVWNIKLTLTNAINHGGTTWRNFYQPNGKQGNFINKLQIYGRSKQPCQVCGSLIQKINYYSRSTFFCLKCQS